MGTDRSKLKKNDAPTPPPEAPREPNEFVAGKRPPLFRKLDWITFAVTALLVFIGYFWTLAPDLTLEDSGELAVGSYYAGVPHPPGYPVWTLYTWLFTVLVPVSNIAWRVALSSAVAGALACGFLGLLVSRGSSMLLEGITDFKKVDRRVENLICVAAGFIAGTLLAFNGFMWSQAVIVEVYTLSVLSFVIVLCFLLRWIYAPEQRRYLYWAFFVFGICFTNHQTLIVAAMGIEVAILAAQRRLGRDLFFGNVLIYWLILILKANGKVSTFDGNVPLFVIFNAVGASSALVAAWFTLPNRGTFKWKWLGGYFGGMALLWLIWMAALGRENPRFSNSVQTFFILYLTVGMAALVAWSWMQGKSEGIGREWKPVLIMGLLWLAGNLFYFYMPIASMTNPPMNWGYPRTVEGFYHALTRGQYDKTNPTQDPFQFFDQLVMYFEGAVNEFNLVYLLIGLVPFLFLSRMQKRERSWLIGLTVIYLLLAVLLLILLNPTTDMQARRQSRVFFTPSHIIIAIAIGYGVTLISGLAAVHYQRFRQWILWGGAAAIGIELYYVLDTFWGTEFPLLRFAALWGLALALAFTALILIYRSRSPVVPLLVVFALIPFRSMFAHWAENEQRGHLFGWYFGHDMFSPPFDIYPEMAEDAILFGGTDPGRFNPTYMIFAESFLPPSKKRDPDFDRRDVYIITQNALADGTYLDYIRAHYNRSAQKDPPFFQNLFHTKLFAPLDTFFMSLGRKIEERRRERGVYPPEEIYTPTPRDSGVAFNEYLQDAERRLFHDRTFTNEPPQVKAGEEIHLFTDPNTGEERVQVSGQVAVMAINGLLTKLIFEKNPDHEFYVEESFPLDWMWPHLSPYGIIMKINREPLEEITEEMTRKDHEFWSRYSERLIGDWIDDDTSIAAICEFAVRVYRRHEFEGFTGDPKFVRDEFAQKAFSKLRSAIGGLYSWRLSNIQAPGPEKDRMEREAYFALRQSFAFCPYSPEAVFKLVSLLAVKRELEDAELVIDTAQKWDPTNPAFLSLGNQIRYLKQTQATNIPAFAPAAPPPPPATSNLSELIQEIAARVQANQSNVASRLIDRALAHPSMTASSLLSVAQQAAQLGDTPRMMLAIRKMEGFVPSLEEAHRQNPNDVQTAFDLVSIYLVTQRTNQAIELLDRLVASPSADASTYLSAANAYAQMQEGEKLEDALERLVGALPTQPEAWYDLAAVQATLGKTNEAVVSLRRAVDLSDQRRGAEPTATDLRAQVKIDGRFSVLNSMPEYQAIMGSQ